MPIKLPPGTPEFLTPAEAAAALGISTAALRSRARRGTIAAGRTPGGTRRYQREDIQAALNSQAGGRS